MDAAASLADAALAMRLANVGTLPVRDGARVVGMVTERDIVVRAVAFGLDPFSTFVVEVMTPKVICCSPDLTSSEALRLMETHTVRQVFVTGEHDRIVGLVTYEDLTALRPEALEPPGVQGVKTAQPVDLPGAVAVRSDPVALDVGEPRLPATGRPGFQAALCLLGWAPAGVPLLPVTDRSRNV